MGVMAKRALGAAFLFLLGLLGGIWIDRAVLEQSPIQRASLEPAAPREMKGVPYPAPAGVGTSSVSPKMCTLPEAERSLREMIEGTRSPQRWRSIERVCSLLPPEDMPAALRMVDRVLRGQPEWDEVLTSMAARWAHADPQRAMSSVEDLKGSLRAPVTLGIVRALAGADPALAREFLNTLPPSILRDRAASCLVEAWAAHDLAAAVGWAKELPEGRMKKWAIEGAIDPWCRSDPRGAATYFEGFPAGSNQYVLGHVASIWAATDPAAASAWATGLSPRPVRSKVLLGVISTWARNDPEAASSFLSSLGSGLLADDRASALARIAGALAESDIERAVSWFQELPPEIVPDDAAFVICMALTDVSPEAAADFVAALPRGDARSHAVADVATELAHGDIGEALAWIEGLGAEEKSMALEVVARTWSESDARAVVDYARKLPPGPTRDGILEDLVGRFSSSEPEKAAALLKEISAETSRDSAALSLVREWCQFDVSRAAAWAEAVPEGKLRKSTLEAVAGEWTTYDPAGAERWISRLPPGESRDAAVAAFVYGMANEDPAAASAWAERIEDPSERTIKLEYVGRKWLEADTAAGRQWILNSPLPDEMKTQLLDPSK